MSNDQPSGVEAALDQMLADHSEEAVSEVTPDEEVVETIVEEVEEVEAPEGEEAESEEAALYELEIGDNVLKLNEDDMNGLVSLKELAGESSLESLQSQIMMHRDYTQKTQEHSKAVEDQNTEYQTRMTALATVYEQAEAVLNAGVNQYNDVDWEALMEDDPLDFEVKFKDYNHRKNEAERIRTSVETALQSYQTEKEKVDESNRVKEIELLQAIMPEAKTPEKWEPLQKEMTEYLTSIGFTDTTVDGISDHRYFRVISDAAKYRKLKSSAPEKALKPAQVLRAGKPVTKIQRDKKMDKEIAARAMTSGSVEDAIDAVAHSLRQKG